MLSSKHSYWNSR